jgi:molybdopterin synthase catalytic subunit
MKTPNIFFDLTEKPLAQCELVDRMRASCVGAMVSFDGLVRDHNEGHYVTQLEYQAYPQLAIRVGQKILLEECERHGVLGAAAMHRTGLLAIGESAVILAVAAEHRGEAFAAAMAILERLKYELPIWKKETYADGAIEWVGPDEKHALTGEVDHATPVWKASIEQIWISPGHDFRGRHGQEREDHGVLAVESVECVPGMGLRGDRYFGYKPNFKGQVTFFEADIVRQVWENFGLTDLSTGVFRRNVVVRGVRLRDWVGRRFVLDGIEFEGVEECKPCYWMDQAVAPGTEKFLLGECRGGLRARILSHGTLRSQVGPQSGSVDSHGL